MTAIVWLASYPKSGNTWLRAFLANYLEDAARPVAINDLPRYTLGDMLAGYYARAAGKPAEALTDAEVNALRPAVHRLLAATRPGAVLVKTHSVLGVLGGVPTITREVTAAAVYVVRNPLDVLPSLADHYGIDLDKAVSTLCSPATATPPSGREIAQVLADWSSHVRSWTGGASFPVHVVRYEDMAESPQKTFGGVVEFLKLPPGRERLKRAIRHASFKVLAEQERRDGFIEKSKAAARFFRQGGTGGWRRALSPAQVAEVVAAHGETMMRFGYLAADGATPL